MTGEQKLVQCLRELELTNARMREAFEAKSARWKAELIGLRRVQSAQLTALSESLAKWSGEALDAGGRAEITRLFAEMRRSIAMTQTEWPLSLVNDETALEAYTTASRRTIDASSAFFSRIRAELGRQ